jgi:hypothetical protein
MVLELVAAVSLSAAPVKPGVDGGLPLEWVEDVIAWRSNDLAACFPAKGKRTSIQYTFGVSPVGRVDRLSLGEVKGDWERVTCVGAIVESLRFPSADGGSAVTWVFASATARDAGVAEERVLDVAEVPASWTNDVTTCLATHPRAVPGRLTVSLDTSALGFIYAAQVTAPAGPAHDDVVECVNVASHAWRFPARRRERLLATWVHAPSEREAKKFFEPSAPAVEIIVGSVPVVRRGGLVESVIHDEIRRHSSRVQACYSFLLARNPKASGKVSVHFTIGPEGDVVLAEGDENTTDDLAIVQCIVGVVKAMHFPKPEGGETVDVTFPWLFHAVD